MQTPTLVNIAENDKVRLARQELDDNFAAVLAALGLRAGVHIVADTGHLTTLTTATEGDLAIVGGASTYQLLGTDPMVSGNWRPFALQSAVDALSQALSTEQTARSTGDTNTLTAAQAYADALMANRQTKAPCRFVTTSNVSLSGLGALAEGTPVAGDRILVVGQTTASQNGLWVAASGAWTRATDADGSNELLPGCTVWVYDGSTYADSSWELSSDTPVTPGTTAQTWANTYRSGLYATASALAAETTRATTAEAGLQPANSNLTAIAGLTPSNDDVLQRKGGAWTNRSIAQLKADLGITSITGQYVGSASTFAGLPTTDPSGAAASNGDWAVLNTDVVGTGTAQNPQYPRGIYFYNGTSYSLALTLSANAVLIGGDTWLKQAALATAFLLTSTPPTYDSNNVVTSSNIAWPDGTTGVYTVTSQDSNGAVLGFTATYAGTTTRTVTVTVPRDSQSRVSGTMTAVVS